MSQPETNPKAAALDQARMILGEHFENVLIVAADDGQVSPEVSTYGTPAMLQGVA